MPDIAQPRDRSTRQSGPPSAGIDIVVRPFRRRDYVQTLQAMRTFTQARSADAPDEIWLVEHEPVFTQGLAGKPGHLLAPGGIPVVSTERGGQVTYHGPGQVVAYTLLDLHRRGLQVRETVCRLEQALIECLAWAGVQAVRCAGAPGVYVAQPAALAGSKIGALGLKVSRGRTFHGVALNVAMDLEPFSRINPCGYEGLRVTDIRSVRLAQGQGQSQILESEPGPNPDRATPGICASAQDCQNEGLTGVAATASRLATCLVDAINGRVKPPNTEPESS